MALVSTNDALLEQVASEIAAKTKNLKIYTLLKKIATKELTFQSKDDVMTLNESIQDILLDKPPEASPIDFAYDSFRAFLKEGDLQDAGFTSLQLKTDTDLMQMFFIIETHKRFLFGTTLHYPSVFLINASVRNKFGLVRKDIPSYNLTYYTRILTAHLDNNNGYILCFNLVHDSLQTRYNRTYYQISKNESKTTETMTFTLLDATLTTSIRTILEATGREFIEEGTTQHKNIQTNNFVDATLEIIDILYTNEDAFTILEKKSTYTLPMQKVINTGLNPFVFPLDTKQINYSRPMAFPTIKEAEELRDYTKNLKNLGTL